jgi:hypothetical protein
MGQTVSPPLHDVNQQWFWYRVGNGAEHPLNNLTFVSATTSDTNPSTDNRADHLELQYTSANFTVTVAYDLIGGPQYSHTTGLMRTVVIVNTGATDLDFHFFDYSDLTLGYAYWDQAENEQHPDLAEVLNSDGSAIRQWDNDGGYDPITGDYIPHPRKDSESQTTSMIVPSHWGLSLDGGAGSILASLTDGLPTTLSDNMTANGGLPGNLAFAFQYDFVLGPGEAWVGASNLLVVPEPASFALVACAAMMISMGRPRRKRLAEPSPTQPVDQ